MSIYDRIGRDRAGYGGTGYSKLNPREIADDRFGAQHNWGMPDSHGVNNLFTSGWSSGQGDRRQPAVPLPIDTMERGSLPAIPMPTVTGAMPGTIPKDIMRGPSMDTMRGWFNKPYSGGPVDSPRPFTQDFQQSMHGPLNPSGIQLAELTQDQMNYMQNPYHNPALGGISEEELWNNVKDMDYVRPWYLPFGKPSQIPAERSEFDDYVNQLQRGKMGPKGPYWSS